MREAANHLVKLFLGKSTGKACDTRADACEAYVSFKFLEEAGFTAVIVRQQLGRTAHDLTNPGERKKNPIHPELNQPSKRFTKRAKKEHSNTK